MHIRFLVTEVHNYGGFFGGDSITLDVAPLTNLDDVRTIVIDARALSNVIERHTILAGMVLDLDMDGERVDQATLLAAKNHEELRDALGKPHLSELLSEPLLLSAHCSTCDRWVVGALWAEPQCQICQAA